MSLEDDAFIRRSYRGGWVFINPEYRGRDVEDLTVYDVNSMFPYQMRTQLLPYGKPVSRAPEDGELYIVSFQAVFDIKEGFLPTIQQKNSVRSNDADFIYSSNNELMDLCMTSVDYELFHEHYNVSVEQNHEYRVFRASSGMFNAYIDYWMEQKKKCGIRGPDGKRDEAGRATAKRFLNSLYGKTGQNPKHKSKIAYLDDYGVTRYETIEDEGRAWYIPVATFITSYARAMIVRAAQKFGEDFVYADTDSIHCVNAENHEKDLDIDPSRLGAWDKEAVWKYGRYLAPKRYIHGNTKTGKPDECKMAAAGHTVKEEITWENFRIGTVYHEKLTSRNVKGGVCLMKGDMELRI